MQPGAVGVGDTVELLERPNAAWPVARVFGLLVGGDREVVALEELSRMNVLAESWRERAQCLLANLSRDS